MGKKKYIPNILTLIRMLLTINYLCFLKMIEENSSHVIYIIYATLIFILICITDFVDGKIARKIKAESKLGSILDVSADFIFIISSLGFWSINDKIPKWFVLLVVLKFIEFIFTSYIIKVITADNKGTFIFDYFGRFSAINFFLMPGMILLTYIGISIEYIRIFIYFTTALVVLSSLERWLSCYRKLKEKRIVDGFNNMIDN